jgi:multicomponent Na+:H+ antiporter subunit D
LFFILIAGAMGCVSSDDLFNIYIFFEISSISAYCLVSLGSKKGSSLSALNYLFYGSISSVFILFSISILYAKSGYLSISYISTSIEDIFGQSQILLSCSYIFFLLGLFIKVGILPFHSWLINIYNNAQNESVPLMSAVGSKISLFLICSITFKLFYPFSFSIISLYSIKLIITNLSIISIVLFSILAIKETNIIKILSYSSICNLSYILIAMFSLNEFAISGGVMHLFTHGVSKSLSFLCVFYLLGVNNKNLLGLGRKKKLVSICLIISLLSLIGIPFTAGFVSKYYILYGLFVSKNYISFITISLSSVITILYFWKIFDVMYLKDGEVSQKKEFNIKYISFVLLSLVILLFGVFSKPYCNKLIKYYSNIMIYDANH